jgi:NAD(P)-dependent dehydrogenase (short-subunit alcohol dehydrogenase family)
LVTVIHAAWLAAPWKGAMTTSNVSCSYVVTGGGRGVGRAVVERLIRDGGNVVAVELDPTSLGWLDEHPTAVAVVGDASDEKVAAQAADRAEKLAPLGGWVNNAAVFRDASLHTSSAREVIDLVTTNLAPAVVGCTVAVRRFLAAGTGGAIVNVSSHQAGRAVPGCTPYVTAKAAIEGLTRAVAVEYGVHGIRVNAVALGSIGARRCCMSSAGRCRAGGGGDAPPASDRSGREARRGCGDDHPPAVRRGELHHGHHCSRRRTPLRARA